VGDAQCHGVFMRGGEFEALDSLNEGLTREWLLDGDECGAERRVSPAAHD